MKTGRPKGTGVLTPAIMDKICLMIKAGNYAETAASHAGIDRTTFQDWLKRGAREKTGRYHTFSLMVDQALAEAEVRDSEVIRLAAADGNWQAAAWRLERRNWQHWSPRGKVEHSGAVTLHHDLDELTDEEINARIIELVSRLPLAGSGLPLAGSGPLVAPGAPGAAAGQEVAE